MYCKDTEKHRLNPNIFKLKIQQKRYRYENTGILYQIENEPKLCKKS